PRGRSVTTSRALRDPRDRRARLGRVQPVPRVRREAVVPLAPRGPLAPRVSEPPGQRVSLALQGQLVEPARRAPLDPQAPPVIRQSGSLVAGPPRAGLATSATSTSTTERRGSTRRPAPSPGRSGSTSPATRGRVVRQAQPARQERQGPLVLPA